MTTLYELALNLCFYGQDLESVKRLHPTQKPVKLYNGYWQIRKRGRPKNASKALAP